jgi:hypothetical protein
MSLFTAIREVWFQEWPLYATLPTFIIIIIIDLKGRGLLVDLDVDERIILKLSLKTFVWGCKLGSAGSGQGPVAGYLNTVMNLRASQKVIIYWLTERLSASQERLCSKELVM